ncbi:MAG: hypothetical protein SH818_18150 [Saprospiraceae bacterium]|nr:hypothetical protein [Saprospiraceae bacterium]
MKSISLVFFVLFVVQSAGAQCPGSSPYWGLNCFLNTDFLKQFEEARNRAEQSVRDFKRIQSEYDEKQIERVMSAYNNSADRFNQVLLKIKGDLLNKATRKYLVKNPDDYAKQISYDLNLAKDFYANNYQKTLVEVTNGQITGAALLALLPKIIQYGKLAFQLFQQLQTELKKYNQTLLDTHLISHHKFHSWEEIK